MDLRRSGVAVAFLELPEAGGVAAAEALALLIGSEKASPWNETERLRVEVTRSLAAAEEASAAAALLGTGVMGLLGLRRPTDWERLGRRGVEG